MKKILISCIPGIMGRALVIIFFFLFHSPIIHSQIYSTLPSLRVATSYPVFTETDSIFVFCGENASLTAFVQGDLTGNFNFSWSRYNSLTNLFEPYASGSGNSHTISNLLSGGYRVQIANGGGYDETFRAWVFISEPVVEVNIVNILCGQIAFSGVAEATVFIYFDPSTGQPVQLPNNRTFQWTSDTGAVIPNPTTNLQPITYLPPVVNTWYKLTVTDTYGCQAEDSKLYETIETKADFEFDPSEGPSPLTVSFTNKSTNATAFNWYFDYTITGMDGIPQDLTENPEHVFSVPGTYVVALRTFSQQGCSDVFINIDNPVVVSPSSLEVPNVFSPNDDGINDLFIVSHNSLKQFHGIILNRAGQKVFEWTDPDKGWNGKHSSGNDATPGAYFYIIKGVGWDGKKYEIKGTMYLFRGK